MVLCVLALSALTPRLAPRKAHAQVMSERLDVVGLRIPVDAETRSQLVDANPGKQVSVEDECAVVIVGSDRSIVVPWFEQRHVEEVSLVNLNLKGQFEYDAKKSALVVRSLADDATRSRQSEWGFQVELWGGEVGVSLPTLVDFGGPILDLRVPSVSWTTDDGDVPEFVGELRHPEESAEELRSKCRNWVNAGVKVVWYIDPFDEQVEVYTSSSVQVHHKPMALECLGFVMPFFFFWEPIADLES